MFDNILVLLGNKKSLKKDQISKKVLERFVFNVNDVDILNALEEYLP